MQGLNRCCPPLGLRGKQNLILVGRRAKAWWQMGCKHFPGQLSIQKQWRCRLHRKLLLLNCSRQTDMACTICMGMVLQLVRADYYQQCPVDNPKGPAGSYKPGEPGVHKHVRGGSFLCSNEYCKPYKAGSRGAGETNNAGNNLGFRCVQNVRRTTVK